jgi:hypothetical protein
MIINTVFICASNLAPKRFASWHRSHTQSANMIIMLSGTSVSPARRQRTRSRSAANARWSGNRLSAISHSESRNTETTRLVFVAASRNGKVIFPSWLGLVSGMPRSIWAAWYAFLGGAQVDIGPSRRCRPEARSFGLLFFPLSAFCKGCHGQEKGAGRVGCADRRRSYGLEGSGTLLGNC